MYYRYLILLVILLFYSCKYYQKTNLVILPLNGNIDSPLIHPITSKTKELFIKIPKSLKDTIFIIDSTINCRIDFFRKKGLFMGCQCNNYETTVAYIYKLPKKTSIRAQSQTITKLDDNIKIHKIKYIYFYEPVRYGPDFDEPTRQYFENKVEFK